MIRFLSAAVGGLLVCFIHTLSAAPDPLHFYDFEGDATDSVGSGDGQFVNAVPDFTDGVIGAQAFASDSIDDYVAIPLVYEGTNYTAVSVSAWVRTTNGSNQIIASSDRSEYWRLEINGNGAGEGAIGWDVRTNTGIVDFGGTTRIDDGEWHHVVGTFDGATGTMRVYIDGYLDAEQVNPAWTVFGTGLVRYTFIGSGSEATEFNGVATPQDSVHGDIDGVGIYDIALTPQDVQEICLVGRGAVNILDLPITSYSGSEDNGTAALTQNGSGTIDGTGITLTGDAWKKVPWSYNVTPNTILEFEVEHTGGELVGIALDEDDDHTQLVSDGTTPSPRVLVVSGTATPGADFIDSPHQYTGPGFQRIQVCIGRYFQGNINNLGFVLDDASGSATATFQKIHIFEAADYNSWALELPIGQRGPLDDPNEDGEVNLISYGYGAPPIAAATAECSAETVTVIAGNGMLEYMMPHTQKPDIAYLIECSDTLEEDSWTPTTLKFRDEVWEILPDGSGQALNGSYELGAKVDITVNPGTAPRRFYRATAVLYPTASNDRDADLINDLWEYRKRLNPGDDGDAGDDGDNDFLTNLQEYEQFVQLGYDADPNVFDPATVSFEVVEAEAHEKEGTPARIRVRRTGSDEPDNIFFSTAPGAIPNYGTPSGSEYTASDNTQVPMGDGEYLREITVTANLDSNNEYPEGIRFAILADPDSNYGVDAGSDVADVFLCDAADTPENETLFLGFYRPELDSITSADGISVLRLNGPKNKAMVTSSFGVMETIQTSSHVHHADPINPNTQRGPIVESLPMGQIETSPHEWDIVPTAGQTGQKLINALFRTPASANDPPLLYSNVHSGEYPSGEIWAQYTEVQGASSLSQADIDRYLNPQGIDVNPVDGLDDVTGQPLRVDGFGNNGYDDPPAGATAQEAWIKRDVVRFLQSGTFGPTPAEVDALTTDIINNHGGDRKAGFLAWINTQLALDQTSLRELSWYMDEQEFEHRADVDADNDGNITSRNQPDAGDQPFGGNFRRAWWTQMLQCHDQLLQRYIFALSEIVVVSREDAILAGRSVANGAYWDMIGRVINGELDTIVSSSNGTLQTNSVDPTYRNLLEGVSKSPLMGIYLSHLKNEKAQDLDNDGITDLFPDENYAREIMQLFSFGLVHLLLDGKIQLDANGLPIPTYTNEDIKELSKVFTGWSFSYYNGGAPNRAIIKNNSFTRGNGSQYYTINWEYPMENYSNSHETGPKDFLVNDPVYSVSQIPNGNNGEQDIQMALDIIGNHPSVAPFISLRLIQRLTSANPSAGYIYRVSKAFEDGVYDGVGSGSRGDLIAVLKAILLDPEARDLALADSSVSTGKPKEPMLSYSQILRGLHARSLVPLKSDLTFTGATGAGVSTSFTIPSLANISSQYSSTPNAGYPASQLDNFPNDASFFRFGELNNTLGQSPLMAPTVFNWFLPDYVPGGALAAGGLVSPELQIATETSVVTRINYHHAILRNNDGQATNRLVGDRNPSLSSGAARFDSIRIDDNVFSTVDTISTDRDMIRVVWDNAFNSHGGTTQQNRTAAATAVVDWLDCYFCAGRLQAQYGSGIPANPSSPTNPREYLIDAIDSQGYTGSNPEVIRTAMYLIFTSPDFLTRF